MSRKSNRYRRRAVIESQRSAKRERFMIQALTGARGIFVKVILPDGASMEYPRSFVVMSDLCTESPSIVFEATPVPSSFRLHA